MVGASERCASNSRMPGRNAFQDSRRAISSRLARDRAERRSANFFPPLLLAGAPFPLISSSCGEPGFFATRNSNVAPASITPSCPSARKKWSRKVCASLFSSPRNVCAKRTNSVSAFFRSSAIYAAQKLSKTFSDEKMLLDASGAPGGRALPQRSGIRYEMRKSAGRAELAPATPPDPYVASEYRLATLPSLLSRRSSRAPHHSLRLSPAAAKVAVGLWI